MGRELTVSADPDRRGESVRSPSSRVSAGHPCAPSPEKGALPWRVNSNPTPVYLPGRPTSTICSLSIPLAYAEQVRGCPMKVTGTF